MRDEIAGGTVNRIQRYYYANGVRVGDVGNDGPSRTDYAQAIAARGVDHKNYKNWQPVASADFDQNHEPVSPTYPGATSTSHTVRNGDTLQSIARSVWGDAAMWYLIADANGLTGGEALKAGQILTLPNKVTNIHDNAGTFRPYRPGEAIGDTSPTLPTAPPAPKKKGGGCGGAKIIVAIVAVVATVFTAGTAAPFLSTAAAAAAGGTGVMTLGAGALLGTYGIGTAIAVGAIGGAVGSIVGQGLSMAAGLQDKFSWSAVATSALTTAAGSGIGAWASGASMVAGPAAGVAGWGSNPLGAIGVAVASNVASQGINMVMGQQKQFSWTSLAVSAISAPIAQAVGGELTGEGGVFAKSDPAVQSLVKSTTSALVSAVTHLAIQGGKLQWEAIAADALSSTIREMYAPQRNEFGRTTAQQADFDEALRDKANADTLNWSPADTNAANTKDSAQNLSSGAQEIFDGLVNAFGSIQQQKPELSQRLRYEQTADLDNRFGVTVTDYPGQIRIPLDGKMPAGRSDVMEVERTVVDDPSIVEIVLPGTNTPQPQNVVASSSETETSFVGKFGNGLRLPSLGVQEASAAGGGTLGSLARNVVGGVFDTLYGLSFGTAENAFDLTKAAGSVAWNELGLRSAWNGVTGQNRGEWYPELSGPVAESYAAGVSQGKLILQATPGLNLLPLGYDVATAIGNENWNGVARLGGGLATGAAIGAGLQRYGNYSIVWSDGLEGALGNGVRVGENVANKTVTTVKPGEFSIVDWTGYPAGVPRPQGPFRLIEGSEYEAARDAANAANSAIRREQGLVGKPVDVHEIKPVKFDGSPTDPANKVVLPRDIHRQQVTPWWNRLQRDISNQ